ncbi:MAG: hypothetical protein KKD29_03245 [Candidatus Omnitrophica bacterium]|nr:hypothetical protein [Candidatus Omnitrophota bacterium]MBU4488645.1 hypothetical protein [Candidatus Omnitrophota bacterium]
MRKIFIFWIIFLVILAIGISLALCSKIALRREERKAEKLKKSIISRPSRVPDMPTAGDKTEVEIVPLVSPSLDDMPSSEDIPVQINTNSLEIDIPAGQPLIPTESEEPEEEEHEEKE